MKKSRERNAHANDATSARATFRREEEEEEEEDTALLPSMTMMRCCPCYFAVLQSASKSDEEKIREQLFPIFATRAF